MSTYSKFYNHKRKAFKGCYGISFKTDDFFIARRGSSVALNLLTAPIIQLLLQRTKLDEVSLARQKTFDHVFMKGCSIKQTTFQKPCHAAKYMYTFALVKARISTVRIL